MNAEIASVLGTGVAIVGLTWRMMASLRRVMRQEIGELRRDVTDLREGMARIEGRLDGYFARQAQET